MLMAIAATLFGLNAAMMDTVPAPPPADSYLDAGARALVERGRERREFTDRSIEQYRTLVRERMSFGVSAMRRERDLFVGELAADVLWRQSGEGEVTLLGARQAFPAFSTGVRVPERAGASAARLAFDPGESDLVRAAFGDSDRSIRHPLAAGSERHYRFRSGDTTLVNLPTGRSIRLIELQVIPRRRDFNLASGSLWLEADTHALVRAVVRPARPWDIDLDGDDDDDVPRWVKPIRGEIRYVAIEYGLWDMRWWLPRLMTLEGTAQVGVAGGIGATLRYERTYADYRVTAAADGEDADTGAVLERCPPRSDDDDARDRPVCVCRDGRCRLFTVHAPADTAMLLAGPDLPASLFTDGPALVTDEEMRQIRASIERMQPPIWVLQPPVPRFTVATPGLFRYNRVEGFSVGARADLDFGAVTLDATARLGSADLEPRLELGAERATFARRLRLAGYRRLDAVDPAQGGLGLGNSLSALFLGTDGGDYLRATGAELIVTPVRPRIGWYRARLYAESQRAAANETEWSVPRLWDTEHRFRPAFLADRADQYGAALTIGTERGRNPAGIRWGAELFVDAEAGDYEFVRPSLTLSSAIPLPGRYRGALAVGAGTSFGDPPAQSEWFLGGTGTVRGYDPLSARGDSFWRARGEVGTEWPAARLILFGDAGWAGARPEWELDPTLLSAGVGVGLVDGLVRFDLARTLRGERRWAATLYFGGAL
jgi:hypothetical protein